MLITFIFRSDRFAVGTIQKYLENGVIELLIDGIAVG